MVERQTGKAPLILRYGVNTSIAIETEHPQATGNDLVANAVAGWNYFHTNCIVVNFGTATTLTAVAEPGRMLGVSIAAGLATTADALAGKAAQLAHIPLAGPPSAIGRNTEHSMQSGLVLGHVAMVEGLIDRMRVELPHAQVIATGGLVGILAPLTAYFDAVDPWLTLEGLRLIAERNRE
jgi:type III pantothenate kinase